MTDDLLSREKLDALHERFLTAIGCCAACGHAPYGNVAIAARALHMPYNTVQLFLRRGSAGQSVLRRIEAWLDKRDAEEQAERDARAAS